MSHHEIFDNNRRAQKIGVDLVDDVLPTHFKEQYPRLSKLLNHYYTEFETSEESPTSFQEQLFATRDINAVSPDLLQYIEDELLMGQVLFDEYSDKRGAIQFANTLYRSKGSKYSLQQFFRIFYDEDPDIVYTKNNVFIVGESELGAESQRYITNDKLYQTYAVLVRAGIPISEWKDLYKTFVHPAGMYIGGEVQIVSVANMYTYNDIMPEVYEDSDAGLVTIVEEALAAPIGYTDITGIVPGPDSAGDVIHLSFNETIHKYNEIAIEDIDKQYDTLEDAMAANSPTTDEDRDSAGDRAIGASNTIETQDHSKYDPY